MSTANTDRDFSEAKNKSLGAVRHQWNVRGFLFDDVAPGRAMQAVLRAKYHHSGGKTEVRIAIRSNVVHLFRYIYFHRHFIGYTSTLLTAAAKGLGADDPMALERAFHRYTRSRRAYIQRFGQGHVPEAAEPSEHTLCLAVDMVIDLEPVTGLTMTEQDKQELDARRTAWKAVISTWDKARNPDEPYLPKGDALLMQILDDDHSSSSINHEVDIVMMDAPEIAMSGDPVDHPETQL